MLNDRYSCQRCDNRVDSIKIITIEEKNELMSQDRKEYHEILKSKNIKYTVKDPAYVEMMHYFQHIRAPQDNSNCEICNKDINV